MSLIVISAPEITAPEASVTVTESVAPTACAPAGIEVKMHSTKVSKAIAIIPAFPLGLQLHTPLLIINFLLFQIMEHPKCILHRDKQNPMPNLCCYPGIIRQDPWYSKPTTLYRSSNLK